MNIQAEIAKINYEADVMLKRTSDFPPCVEREETAKNIQQWRFETIERLEDYEKIK